MHVREWTSAGITRFDPAKRLDSLRSLLLAPPSALCVSARMCYFPRSGIWNVLHDPLSFGV